MPSHSYLAKPCALMLCALLGGAGCDLVAKAGETLELANGGTTFGTGGNAQTRPGRAVTVEDGGTVVVKDATVLGGGILVQQVDQQRFTRAGAGIFSAGGGTIRVEQGVVAGGGVALQVALPEATFDEPAPGIEATDSSIEVMGGTVRGGALVSEVGPFPRPPVNMAPRVPGPAIVSMRGTLNLRGGSFMPGAMDPVDPLIPPVAVITVGSQLNILGGSFRGAISTQNSQTRIRAGTFDVLLVIGGCAEIRGGQINELDVLGNRAGIALLGGRVVVAGSGLTLTPITPSDPALGLSRLTGTLENGQQVNVRVTNSPLFGGVVQLVAPRAAGCP